MHFALTAGPLCKIICDTLVIALYDKETVFDDELAAVDKNFGGLISSVIKQRPKCSQFGTTTVLYNHEKFGPSKIMLIGAGKKEELTEDKVRSLTGSLARELQKHATKTVACKILDNNNCKAVIQAMVEGAVLGTYKFEHYKSKKEDNVSIEKFIIAVQENTELKAVEEELHTYVTIAEGVCFARDLVNHPSNHMTPSILASTAEDMAKNYGLEVTILDKNQMEKHNMGALLAVTKGSDEPPKMITLKYTGAPDTNELVAFVGKGVTFDSGGISLKPGEGMEEMKDDMAGGAAVLGAMQAIARIKPAANIIGIVPCVENMPSGHAIKPGDIVTSMSGKTIEIINTDAEGRLILADAVSYARHLGATKIIDIATLTGACVVALGRIASGVISNNESWCQTILAAAKQVGEKFWQLPAYDDYLEQIKSPIADCKNVGGRPGGTITGGLFIGQFADDTPWVHIDIAGTATSDSDSGYNVKGGTGVGVRTLVQIVKNANAC